MNNVNPTLASATQALYAQSSGLTDVLAKEPKVTDKTMATTSAANNTTVTLSDQSKAPAVDYTDLAKNQMVNSAQSVEEAPIDANQATNNLSSASDLQLRANYLSAQNSLPT